MKINKYESDHMTNMAAMLVYGKIIKKKKKKKKNPPPLLLRNQSTDCLDTLYVVLGFRDPS